MTAAVTMDQPFCPLSPLRRRWFYCGVRRQGVLGGCQGRTSVRGHAPLVPFVMSLPSFKKVFKGKNECTLVGRGLLDSREKINSNKWVELWSGHLEKCPYEPSRTSVILEKHLFVSNRNRVNTVAWVRSHLNQVYGDEMVNKNQAEASAFFQQCLTLNLTLDPTLKPKTGHIAEDFMLLHSTCITSPFIVLKY